MTLLSSHRTTFRVRMVSMIRPVASFWPTDHNLGVTYSYETVNDAPAQADVQNSPEDSGEANLDIQYLLATGWPVNIHTYSIAGRGYLIPDLDQPTQDDNDNEPFVDWLSHMLAQEDEDLPHTVATSYGENEQSVPERYRLKVCEMIGQLGARGVSVL